MPSHPRTAIAIAALTLVALTGCVPDGPTVTPDPSPTATPIFESDEAALAAAEEAYRAYMTVSNSVTADGGKRPERIDAYLGKALKDDAYETFRLYLERGIRTVGVSKVDSLDLQQISENGDGTGRIRLYLCLDVSDVRIVDSNNQDVTPARSDRLPLEIEYEFDSKPTLTLVESDTWTGDNFCEV